MAGPTNELLAKQISEDLYLYETEPISLEEAKLYMKIDDDITEDDDLITSLITVARRNLENYTVLSFIPKTVLVQLKNECGGMELPFGPIQQIPDPSLITDFDGNVSNITVYGKGGFYYIPERFAWLQLIYGAGYGYDIDLPDDLKTAIKALVFSLYHNRGDAYTDEAYRSKEFAYQLAAQYCRNWDTVL